VSRPDRLDVVLLIRSLNRGGAERQLALLSTGLDAAEFRVRVVTFYPGGPIWDELTAQPSVELISLAKRGRWDTLEPIRRLSGMLAAWAPAILHCYMPEPSIVGTIAGRRAGVPAIVWGVRSSNVDYRTYGWFNWATARVAAHMSARADLIIANSDAGRAHHVALGYPSDRVITIPNGIDADRFQPSAEARVAGRQRWQLADDEVAIGVVARLDPMKGHPVLLRALVSVARQMPAVRVVCVGGGAPGYAQHLAAETRRLNLERVVRWTGELDHLDTRLPAFDLVCSPSVFGEGFSNAIAEAMACECPCVATNVGDSAVIVGDTGLVVPPADPESLADALVRMARLAVADRQTRGRLARARVVNSFSLHAMILRTATTYRDLARRPVSR
jgi:glycosyltransferase involved in cell wall biosynthesis